MSRETFGGLETCFVDRESFGGFDARYVPLLSDVECRISLGAKLFLYSIDDRRQTNAVTSFETINRLPTDETKKMNSILIFLLLKTSEGVKINGVC
jgi:hypothetical protein